MTIDRFWVQVFWRPTDDTLAAGAERLAATVRAVSRVWPECTAWSTGRRSQPLPADDPGLADRLVPRLRASREQKIWKGTDALGDASTFVRPVPDRALHIALRHDLPRPVLADLQVKAGGDESRRLVEQPERFVDLLRELITIWPARMGTVNPALPFEWQRFQDDDDPRLGWTTWLRKDVGTVDPSVGTAAVGDWADGQLVVLHDPPDAVRRESIDEVADHITLPNGRPFMAL